MNDDREQKPWPAHTGQRAVHPHLFPMIQEFREQSQEQSRTLKGAWSLDPQDWTLSFPERNVQPLRSLRDTDKVKSEK